MNSRRRGRASEGDDMRALHERIAQLEQQVAKLRASEEELEILFEHAPDGYYLSTLTGTFVDGNRAAERITGYKREELIGKSFLQLKLLPPGETVRASSLLARNALGRSTGPDEFTLIRKDGAQIPVEIRTHPVRISDRRLILGIARDISRRKRAEAALQESEERFRDIIEHAHDLIQSVSPQGRFEYVNKAWLDTLGYREKDVGRLTLLDVLHPDSHAHCMSVFGSVLAGQTADHVEATFLSSSGEAIPVEGNVSCRFRDGAPVSTRGIFRDVTERKRYEERLARMARHDPLTGALNRYALDELLSREAARSERSGRPIGLLMIDINRFKEINDRFGHAMGDRVLQGVADLLQRAVRASDMVVRYGGDEFLIVLPETDEEADDVRHRLLSEIDERNRTNPLLDFPVTLAIGSIHWSPGSGRTVDQALEEADRRMYENKRGPSSPVSPPPRAGS